MMKALINFKMDECALNRIKEVKGYEFIVVSGEKEEEKYIRDCQVYISFAPNKSIIEQGENLKWVAALSAGVDYIPFSLLKERKIILTNGSGIHRTHMAEFAISMMIALSRSLNIVERNNRNKVWENNLFQDQIYGKTVGILGLGSIGSEIARYSKLLGMKVAGIKKNTAPVDYVDRVYGQKDIEKVFKESDFVVNVLPLTAETEEIVSYKYLSVMKEDSYYINIGRGKTTNEEDLIKILKEKRIRGAALDVFYNEPLPQDSPFWDMDNVIITPHISGISREYADKALNILLPNLTAYRDNKKMINLVNLETGY